MTRVLLQNVPVLINYLDRDQKLHGFNCLFVGLNDELGAVAARLLQLLPIYEVLNDVEYVLQLAKRSQFVAAELKV